MRENTILDILCSFWYMETTFLQIGCSESYNPCDHYHLFSSKIRFKKFFWIPCMNFPSCNKQCFGTQLKQVSISKNPILSSVFKTWATNQSFVIINTHGAVDEFKTLLRKWMGRRPLTYLMYFGINHLEG